MKNKSSKLRINHSSTFLCKNDTGSIDRLNGNFPENDIGLGIFGSTNIFGEII